MEYLQKYANFVPVKNAANLQECLSIETDQLRVVLPVRIQARGGWAKLFTRLKKAAGPLPTGCPAAQPLDPRFDLLETRAHLRVGFLYFFNRRGSKHGVFKFRDCNAEKL
jgi:hypothetical protein